MQRLRESGDRRCPVCRDSIYQPPQLRPGPRIVPIAPASISPGSLSFNTDVPNLSEEGGMSDLERLGGGWLLLEPNATATAHAIPISHLPRYQENVAIYWDGEIRRGNLRITDDGIIWYHPEVQDVTNDPDASNPTLSWGATDDSVRSTEANGQPVLAESRSKDPVIYLGDGREMPVERYSRTRDRSCSIM
jgi:hypothetical protein